MSVYTSLNASQLKQLLQDYKLGEIQAYEGISDGIENTNYRIKTTTGPYILTIFEQHKAEDMAFFLQLMAFLQHHGLSVPEPVKDHNQQILTAWQSKPAALFSHLPGKSLKQPQENHCQQIGQALGKLHQTGHSFPLQRTNLFGTAWLQQTANNLLDNHLLTDDDSQLLKDELLFQHRHTAHNLPNGVIHADLFRDNALFENQRLSGILDFYTACNAPLLLDLAITANDWCMDDNHSLDSTRTQALISAYQQERPLLEEEKHHWSVMLRLAALRFWLSRLNYRQSAKVAELTQDKDPDVLKCLLLNHRDNEAHCLSMIDGYCSCFPLL